MTNPTRYSAASADEVANYLTAANRAETALRSAIRLLKAQQTRTADPDESLFIVVAILDLQAAVAKILADRIAFSAEVRAIRPPSEADVTVIKDLARAIDAMTASSVSSRQVVLAATDLIERFGTTRA